MFNVPFMVKVRGGGESQRTLWKIKSLPPSRGVCKALQTSDHLMEGVSPHPPGSRGRVAALISFYQAAHTLKHEASAFVIPE